jgi:hypothetical protein
MIRVRPRKAQISMTCTAPFRPGLGPRHAAADVLPRKGYFPTNGRGYARFVREYESEFDRVVCAGLEADVH